jgi:hypothetical protein
VQVVDHEHDLLVQRVKVGDETLDECEPVELRRRRELLDERVLADPVTQAADQREPEALRVALTPVERDPGDPQSRLRLLQPGTQQECLAAARGRRHDGDAPRQRTVEDIEQLAASDETSRAGRCGIHDPNPRPTHSVVTPFPTH